MPRRSRRDDPESLRKQLVELLTAFDSELRLPDVRPKVKKLIPAFHLLRDLGSSLIQAEGATAARDRILLYFRRYPRTLIAGEELMVVAGIQDWPRRVRELRVQLGWLIVTGHTAKAMLEEEEFPDEEINASQIGRDDYVLLNEDQDREAAHRWNVANSIRRESLSVKNRLLKFFRANVGQTISGEELRYVARGASEWARRVRELRTEGGWPIVTKTNGRPDLPVGTYSLESDRQSPEHDRNIPDSVRRRTLRRDGYRCQHCSWSHAEWNRDDPRHLELHHVHPHLERGSNVEENLLTLCVVCHDEVHRKP